ncbi:MAG: hypothetical protein HKP44_06500, partial [Desulfofustis sp.]|nr:hypothetical protein [Desulfofustis sp.]
PEDREIDLGQATAAVLGMGRIGTAAYDKLREKQGKTVVSLDFDEDRIPALKDEGGVDYVLNACSEAGPAWRNMSVD